MVRARLGPDDHVDKDATLFGTVVRWQEWCVSCEANPKYRAAVLEALGLREISKSLSWPGAKGRWTRTMIHSRGYRGMREGAGPS